MGFYFDPNIIGAPGTWSPALQGATDNPTVTYTTQVGKYVLMGKLCRFALTIITSTMSKTTLTDAVRITLPFAAVTASGLIQVVNGIATNGTPVQNANMAYINSSNSYLTLAQLGLTVAQADITYALTSLGILTNTVTVKASGIYEVA
jgi:hypothetical protein